MKASRIQAAAASEQVAVMRADSEEARRRRAQQDERLGQQIAAVGGIADETRAAARAQLQPIVFAHAIGAHVRGPNDNLGISEGQLAFPYFLANEGTGIALNIRHGFELAGTKYEFGGGMEMRVLRAGEESPLRDPATGKLVQIRPFAAVVSERVLPADWPNVAPVYWTGFDNVFGERFETRNPSDPRLSASFERA
jgi:hypothetical protein